MEVEQFLNVIANTKMLPGVDAHAMLMPKQRPFTRAEVKNIEEYRFSAVGIVCYANPCDEIEFLLIERPVYDGAHSGQMAFPGGKVDESDIDLFAAAKREVWEEVGIVIPDDAVVLELTEMLIPVSQFIVQPFVFYLPTLPMMTLSEREVAEVYHVTLEELLEDQNIRTTDIRLNEKMMLRDIPYYHLQDKVVWGATAVILSEFRALFV